MKSSRTIFIFSIIMLTLLFIIQLSHYIGLITNQNDYVTLFPSLQENKFGFLVNIQSDTREETRQNTTLNNPVNIIVNGKKTATLIQEPILLYLQRGDVLEVDATSGGLGLLSINILGQLDMPNGWPSNLKLNNKRYRFPPIL